MCASAIYMHAWTVLNVYKRESRGIIWIVYYLRQAYYTESLLNTPHLSAATNSSLVIGVLNIPQVPSVATLCPSELVVAEQSLRVTTLKPFSHAVRMVLSTQQLLRKPHNATVVRPLATKSSSRSVPGKASRPFLPVTLRSPSACIISLQISEFQVPSTNRPPSAQPFRMPRFLFGLSDMSAAKRIGQWRTLPPAARTAAAASFAFCIMPVSSITGLTPS